MSEKNQVNLVSMEFNEIKQSLKEFMKRQDEFKDYNFEGSGLNVLLDVLAYNSQNNAYLANMVANELDIDTAVIRSNIVSRAKLMGYTPKSTTAARAVLKVSVYDPTKRVASLVMPRGTRFVVKSDRKQYVFVTLKEYNLKPDGTGAFVHDAIEVFEGTIKAYTFDVTSDERRYVIPSKSIDTSTMLVAVYDNATSNDFTIYERAQGIAKIDANTTAYWLYETDGGLFEIKWGDGTFGKRPPVNGVVYTEYLESSGSVANDLTRFSLVGSFAGFEDAQVSITTVAESVGGAEPESESSIRINAPRFFQSQNRAVTKSDFSAVARDVYPYAKSVSVWGGEESDTPQFGKVFVCIIPKNNHVLTEANRKDIARKIADRSIVGIQPVVIDPKYIHMNMTVYVTVRNNTIGGLGDFQHEIRSLVARFFEENLGEFDRDFYYSNLLTEVKNHSRHITGVRADFTISVKHVLKEKQEKVHFRNAITEGSLTSLELETSKGKGYLKDVAGKVFIGDLPVGTVDYKRGIVTLDTKDIRTTELELFAVPTKDEVTCGFAGAVVLNQSRLSVEIKTQ